MQTITYGKEQKARVSESEIKSRISAVKNSLNSSKFDPNALTKMYNAITEGRGYSVFSKEGYDAWHNENGHMGHADIRKVANFHADAFMKSVTDPTCSDHLAMRDKFKNEFNGDEQAVRSHFVNETNLQYGRTFHGGPSCNKDNAYEGRMLVTSPTKTQTDAAEKETLKNLMVARWNAQGYRAGDGVPDNDQQFVDRFFNEYAINLKPVGR